MLNHRPRDFTDQENMIAKTLDSMGIRYEQQAEFGKYTVDFYIPEIKAVVEADGVYGHLRKADRIRDKELVKLIDIERVIHIAQTKKADIQEELELQINGGNTSDPFQYPEEKPTKTPSAQQEKAG